MEASHKFKAKRVPDKIGNALINGEGWAFVVRLRQLDPAFLPLARMMYQPASLHEGKSDAMGA
jgi:hypothetical protein